MNLANVIDLEKNATIRTMQYLYGKLPVAIMAQGEIRPLEETGSPISSVTTVKYQEKGKRTTALTAEYANLPALNKSTYRRK